MKRKTRTKIVIKWQNGQIKCIVTKRDFSVAAAAANETGMLGPLWSINKYMYTKNKLEAQAHTHIYMRVIRMADLKMADNKTSITLKIFKKVFFRD